MRRDFSFMECRTHAVAVFALDEGTSRPEWPSLESLGGEIVFLSANSSVSVPSSRYPGARGDRIYFGQEMSVDGCCRRKDCPHQHCEVFDMRTSTAEELCMGTTAAPGHERWYGAPARHDSFLLSRNTPVQTRRAVGSSASAMNVISCVLDSVILSPWLDAIMTKVTLTRKLPSIWKRKMGTSISYSNTRIE